MPTAVDAGLHHVCVEVVGTAIELCKVGLCRHASAMCGKAGAEHIGDEHQLHLFTNRAGNTRRSAEILGSPNELRVGVAHLVATEPAAPIFVDERAPLKPVIDDRPGECSVACAIATFAKRIGRERHSGVRLANRTRSHPRLEADEEQHWRA